MLDVLAFSILGCILGTITGLTPGLHVNTIALLALSLYPTLGITHLEFVAFIVSMAITHTFLDFIPAIFIGVPEEETALSILPSHELFLKGRALEAIKITAYGSLLGLTISILLSPLAIWLMPLLYTIIHDFIAAILILAICILMIREGRDRIHFAFLSFFLSGFLGILIFKQKFLSATEILFPTFLGLFGISTILCSLKEGSSAKIPQDKFIFIRLDQSLFFSSFLGSIGGILINLLPALSPSQIGILLYEIFGYSTRNFLISISAVNTSDAIYSFIALYTIHNPRSGASIILHKVITLDHTYLLFIIAITAFSALFATVFHLKIGKLILSLVEKIKYEKISIATLVFCFFLVYFLTGIFGVFICVLSTLIGLIPVLSKISRTHCMGVLIVPTLAYYLRVPCP